MRLPSKYTVLFSSFCVGLVLTACSGEPASDIGVTEQTLPAPAGASSAYVSNTLPGTWAPDERRIVSVTMNNDGTTTWTPTGPTYVLTTQVGSGTWGWSYTAVDASVAPGNNHTYNMVLTAPSAVAPTTADFRARMRALGTDQFGAVAGTFTQNIVPGTTPEWACSVMADDIPATMAPGEKRVVTVTFENVGTGTWPASGMYVESRETGGNPWGTNRNPLPAGTVAPGGTATVSFTLTAPTTAGTYDLERELANFGPGLTLGLFRTRPGYCIDRTIDVTGGAILDSTFVNNAPFPTTMVTNDVASVTVTMTNTGSETWLNDGNYVLYSANSPTSLWNTTSTSVPASTVTGNTAAFTFFVRAPSTGGSYFQQWRMRKLSGAGAGSFGEAINIGVMVDAMGTPSYGATVASQTIPTLVTAGEGNTFSITMQNSGSTDWVGSNFQLYSTNSPTNLWLTVANPLGGAETVAAGASRVFSFSVNAPVAAGTYASSWRMRENGGAGLFGDTATTANIVVTLCGNGTLNGGETCDDNNLTNGDGCSDTCAYEQTVVDLSTETPDRGIRGSDSSAQVNAVTIGDVTGDGQPEIFVSQFRSATGVVPARGGAGTVYGYDGGSGFFTGAVSSVPTGSAIQVVGASTNDYLGLIAGGRIVIGEVTGDATGDLVVSAPNADGAMEGRLDSGEVFVLAGGPALMTAGLVDLGAMTFPTQVTARIYGRTAGDKLSVLATGDVTGDGVGDLVLGAPGDSTNGAGAGALFIVPGPVTGEIDLNDAMTNTFYTILGTAAGQAVGATAVAVGNFAGSATADLLLGVPAAEPTAVAAQGAAYAFFGPITANTTLAGANTTWAGGEANVKLGSTVAVGNVIGTAANEAIIGATQFKNAGKQSGGVALFSGVTAGSFVMTPNGATSATTIIYGADSKDNCGSSLAVGRIDGDSYDDIFMGCGLADGPANAVSNMGEAHVILGANTSLGAVYDLATRPSRFVVFGALLEDRLARYLESAAVGDIDGDGLADLCVGAYDGGGSGPPVEPGEVDCFTSPF